MSTTKNLKQANEAREHELNPWPSPIWSFPELSDVENSLITKARLVGYAGFFPCMNGGLDQARKTLVGAKDFLDQQEAKEWIVVAIAVGPGPFANRFYWTRDDPGYSSHPELAMRLTREKAEYIADDNNREGFSAYDAKWHWTVENANAD